MAIITTVENVSGDRRTTTVPVHVWQDDGVTVLTQAAATSAVLAAASATFNVPPRDYPFRQLSAFSWRFFLEYSTHVITQDTATPDNEVLEFPRLMLPNAKSLIYPLERLPGSAGASGSDPEGRFLVPSNAGAAASEYEAKRVDLPVQNTNFSVDIPTAEKYATFLAGLKAAHGKINLGEFQGHPAGCVMILTAAAISPPGEIPRIDIGAAVGELIDITIDGQTISDVQPFSWVGQTMSGEAYGVVAPRDQSLVADGTVAGLHELRVFEEADYDSMELPEPS